MGTHRRSGTHLAIDLLRRAPALRSFEDLVGDTRAVLVDLGRHLGMEPLLVEPLLVEPLLPRPVRGRWGSRVRRLFAREPEATTVPA